VNLPDLAGQPPWVVVVVFFLFVAGTLGMTWIRRDRADAAEVEAAQNASPLEPGAVPSALTSADSGAHNVAQAALMHLAAVAEREAAESAAARLEADKLRERLEACTEERQRLTHLLAANERERERLTWQLENGRRHTEGRA
jgi:hypothetical protein